MEVFDAELHAVHEALHTVSLMEYSQRQIYVCIDNASAIQILANNPDCVEGGFQACKAGQRFLDKGWKINTVWTPITVE